MSDNGATPYIERHPGDLITAEDWNGLQAQVQADLKKRIRDATNDILHGATPVDHALDSEKFDHKTPKNWTDELDERYAAKVHDHEGMASYRRYFRRMEQGQVFVPLEHKLGRFPLVDVYQVLPITVPSALSIETPPSATETEFLLYYGHEEIDLLQQQTLVTDTKIPRKTLGIPWERLLHDYEVQYEDDDSLGDVINDFFDAFFRPPAADDMDHLVSKWIDDHRDEKTIGDLKKRDEWSDIRWLVLAQKLSVGGAPLTAPPVTNPVDVIHLSYDTAAIKVDKTLVAAADTRIDLMILLRS